MDLTAPFKTEVLRPITTLIVPGTIAVGPFVLILEFYVAAVANFRTEHAGAFAVLLVISVLAAGFVIEDLGASIELRCWDTILDRRNGSHKSNWDRYLKLQLNDEIIGQRYLRNKVTQLKFELSMGPALLIFWIGLCWLQSIRGIWSSSGFVGVTLLIFAGAVYLLWESFKTALVLSQTRALILKAVAEGPEGIPRQGSKGGARRCQAPEEIVIAGHRLIRR